VARIRTIKPEMFQDEKLAPCDPTTRLVFVGLIAMADDAGRVLDNVRVIDAFIFPETRDSSHEPLMRLSGMGRVIRGKTASGQRVLQIVNWEAHQKIQHPNLRSALPEIVEVQEVTVSHEPLMNDSRGAHEPLTHHTNDLRPVPTTNDHVQRAPKARRASGPVADDSKYPEFSLEARAACLDVWKAKLGVVSAGQLFATIGPMFRPTDDAFHVPPSAIVMGVRDYCGLVTKGRSAPFASVADLGKKIGALSENAKRYHDDPASRTDGAMLIVHGTTKVAA
jgi:hypothetical protein